MKTVVKIGTLQWVIIALTLVTAVIHLFLGLSFGDMLMLMNSLGYLGLLAGYFLPLPVIKLKRDWIRWAFVAYTAVTIVAYFVSQGLVEGLQSPLGIATKVVELALIAFLLRDR
jgi:hypothetical protein